MDVNQATGILGVSINIRFFVFLSSILAKINKCYADDLFGYTGLLCVLHVFWVVDVRGENMEALKTGGVMGSK